MLGQTIKKIDGTNISVDSLQNKINYLIKAANVSGVCVFVFNNNKPVFSKAFGLANVPAKQPLTSSSVMYAASFAKVVFAYIVMQFVQEKVIELVKPLVEYLAGPLVDYKIRGWKKVTTILEMMTAIKKLPLVCALTIQPVFPTGDGMKLIKIKNKI